MDIVELVLRQPEIRDEPPVLVDIGASGELNPAWRRLAKYSVCLAFDPDDREMVATRRSTPIYRELRVLNRAVSTAPTQEAVFYLTSAPACSSLLPPNAMELANWEFSHRFSVVRKAVAQTISLQAALAEAGLTRVDWFKTDSQGTDLRLFLSLGEAHIGRVIVAEFEPGIINAYEGEDKLWNVLKRMDELGFWMSDMHVKGSSRIRTEVRSELTRVEQQYLVHLHRASPGWAEVTYLNSMIGEQFSRRDYLLAWVCAIVRAQYGFATELASRGELRFGGSLFPVLKEHAIQRMRLSYFNPRPYLSLMSRAIRKWKKMRAQRHPNKTG